MELFVTVVNKGLFDRVVKLAKLLPNSINSNQFAI